MTMLRSGVTIGWTGLGLALLVACSADTGTIEDTSTSSETLRRGGRSEARRGRPDHDRGHRHGPRCGHHGHGHGHGKGGGMGKGGGAGTGSGSGATSGGGGTSGASSGGTGGTSNGGTGAFAGTAGTGGSFGGVGGGGDPGVCGDGVWSFFEQCDDANLVPGDGCDAVCQIEAGFTCDGAACREVVCGDSLQDFYAIGGGLFDIEGCDDGNDAGGDGCSSTCDIELGFVCFEPGLACREVVCGDGFQDEFFIPGEGGTGGSSSGGTGSGGFAGTSGSAGSGGGGTFFIEGCDDGNVTPGDGCSATCDLEDGFICDRPGVPCREPRCGDGFIDFIPGPDGSGGTGGTGSSGGASGSAGMGGGGTFEECDDGNAATSDGCTASCTVEPGFACPEAGNPCHVIVCGDGMADWPDEECDDGNSTPDDGCTDCTFDGGGGSGGFGGTFGMGGGPTAGSAPTAGSGG